MKRIYIVLLILVAFLFSCSEKEADNFGPPRHPPRRGKMGQPGPVFGDINRMKRDLELTDSQISEIKKINDSFGARHREISDRMQPYINELMALLKEERIDYETVRSVLMKMAEVDVDRQIYMIQHRLKIEEILTEEQRNKIKKRRD